MTEYLRIYSLICDSFVRFDFEEKKTCAVTTENQRLETDKKDKQHTTKLLAHNTRLCALAADVHFAGVAPAFTLSFHDSERSRKPPNAHSLSLYGQL